MRLVGFLILLSVMACGDDEPIVQRARPASMEQTTTGMLGVRTGVVHEVQMTGSIQVGFQFEPAEITIRVGDTVRWVNASGFPHNVAFYADRIPAGAAVVIQAVMPSEAKLGPMIGRILSEAGETFEMDFLSAPAGTYHYFSVPQEASGMVGSVTVANQ